MPASERSSGPPISDRELSQLYRELASECFVKAVITDQADRADALMRMGHHYIAHAAALDRSVVRGQGK